jgi:hypothetical protein
VDSISFVYKNIIEQLKNIIDFNSLARAWAQARGPGPAWFRSAGRTAAPMNKTKMKAMMILTVDVVFICVSLDGVRWCGVRSPRTPSMVQCRAHTGL